MTPRIVWPRAALARLLVAAGLALAGWPGISATPAEAAVPPATSPSVRVPVLMYHHIGAPVGHASDNEFYVAPAAFDLQMAYLAANNFAPVSLEQVQAALQGQAALPPEPVAITFDDANQDNYTAALPILMKYHLSATFLIVTGWVGKPDKLTWDEIAQMQGAGMHFGAHTVTHPYLPRLPLDVAASEINKSKADLEAHLGEPVTVFAYPYGHTAPSITRLVQQAGFKLALGTSPYRPEHSAADSFFLTRFGVYDWTSLSSFESHVPASPVPLAPIYDLAGFFRIFHWDAWGFP